MRKQIFTMWMISVIMAVLLAVPAAHAKTTQDDIDKAKNEINELQEQKEQAQDAVKDIVDEKEELEEELGSLNDELNRIADTINALETQISEKEKEIKITEQELKQAQEQLQKQYEDMKMRIQFMYENGNSSAWEILIESQSAAEFLNRTEYVSRIHAYDRKKLAEYQQLQTQIEEKKMILEQEKEQFLAMSHEKQESRNQINSLISRTQQNIAQAGESLEQAQSEVEELEKEIQKMIAYEKKLEEQKAREDAKRLAAIKEQEKEDTSGVVYVPAESDAYLLGAIIQCESDGEPYEGKLAVGSVIMNRVKSSYFPNTIAGVIYQSGQFSPVASGRLAYRLQAGVNNTCLQAAQEVLNGKITMNCLYFRTNNGIVSGTIIGNHVFY